MSIEQHERDLVVWNLPTAVERGQRFRVNIGAKCSGGCAASGWQAEILDHDGNCIARPVIGGESWPATDGLYFAEVELLAPAEAGLFTWQVSLPGGETDAASHAEANARFNVRSVPPGDCCLKVVAIDRASQQPVAGLRVVAHPYRTTTDRDGVAELRLPSGQYRLFVSGKDYFPFRSDGKLTADLTIRAELELDRGPSDAELWS